MSITRLSKYQYDCIIMLHMRPVTRSDLAVEGQLDICSVCARCVIGRPHVCGCALRVQPESVELKTQRHCAIAFNVPYPMCLLCVCVLCVRVCGWMSACRCVCVWLSMCRLNGRHCCCCTATISFFRIEIRRLRMEWWWLMGGRGALM